MARKTFRFRAMGSTNPREARQLAAHWLRSKWRGTRMLPTGTTSCCKLECLNSSRVVLGNHNNCVARLEEAAGILLQSRVKVTRLNSRREGRLPQSFECRPLYTRLKNNGTLRTSTVIWRSSALLLIPSWPRWWNTMLFSNGPPRRIATMVAVLLLLETSILLLPTTGLSSFLRTWTYLFCRDRTHLTQSLMISCRKRMQLRRILPKQRRDWAAQVLSSGDESDYWPHTTGQWHSSRTKIKYVDEIIFVIQWYCILKQYRYSTRTRESRNMFTIKVLWWWCYISFITFQYGHPVGSESIFAFRCCTFNVGNCYLMSSQLHTQAEK